MQPTLTLQETDPHDIFVIEPDVVLAARPDAARPDAVRTDAVRADAVRADNASVDPVHEALSRLAQQRADIQPKVSAAAPSPTVDTTFRAAAIGGSKPAGKRSAFGRWVRNTSVGFVFALVSAMAAALWTHHGHAAKQMIADWLPPFVLAASSPVEPPPPAEQPNAPTQAATADQASAPPAQPSDSAAAPAAAAADAAPSVQSMARDIATMGQQIDQLKASIEQLKANQAQMARDVAKPSEPSQRPRVATLPPRPVVAPAPVRKPRPAYQAYQPAPAAVISTSPPPLPAAAPLPQQQPALSQSAPPSQAAAEDGGPVVRPPLPLR
jgi:hypothetical protein